MNTYVIVNKSDFFDEIEVEGVKGNFSKKNMGNIAYYDDGLRVSSDGTKVLLKYSGTKPSYFEGLTTYTREEILVEMAKSEWN